MHWTLRIRDRYFEIETHIVLKQDTSELLDDLNDT